MKILFSIWSRIKHSKVWLWIKQNKFALIGYFVISSVLIIVANLCIDSEIDESYDEIQNEINYGIFKNKISFGTRDESYTIVSYTKSEVPPMTLDNDSSTYKQKYGGIKSFYRASSGWTIRVFKKTGNVIVESSIKPYAVGLKSSSSSSPESLFSRLYNNITADEDYNIDVNNEFKIAKLRSLTTKFHKVKVDYYGFDNGLIWYDYSDGKAYSQIREVNYYIISADYSKIDLFRALYCGAAFLLATLLYWTLIRLFKRKPKASKNKFNLDISLNKSSEIVENSNEDVKELLSKINPANFMSPYDPEKVKIANDLYSVLINSQDNETIVSMIREKAKSELGIN